MKLKLNLAALVWEKPFAGAFGQKLFCKCVVFATCAVFSKPPEKKTNAMWGYPKIAENQVFLHVHVFVLRKSSKNCGGVIGAHIPKFPRKTSFAIRKRQTFLIFCIFGCFQETSKNSGGPMLLALWGPVSLCGAMWHYPQSRKTHVFLFFAAFAVLKKPQKKPAPRCVALSKTARKKSRRRRTREDAKKDETTDEDWCKKCYKGVESWKLMMIIWNWLTF